jgi:hypothetical protein
LLVLWQFWEGFKSQARAAIGQANSKSWPSEMEPVSLREEGRVWAIHRFDVPPECWLVHSFRH